MISFFTNLEVGGITSEIMISAVIGLLVLIAIFVALPLETINAILAPVNYVLREYFPWINTSAGKLGHMFAFFAVTLVALIIARSRGWKYWWVGVALIAFGVLTELSQIFIDNRNTRLKDLGWDAAGISMGYFFYFSGRGLKWLINEMRG